MQVHPCLQIDQSNALMNWETFAAGWPDQFVKKIAQNVAQAIFSLNFNAAFTLEKSSL
jgi:hypothetical protein